MNDTRLYLRAQVSQGLLLTTADSWSEVRDGVSLIGRRHTSTTLRGGKMVKRGVVTERHPSLQGILVLGRGSHRGRGLCLPLFLLRRRFANNFLTLTLWSFPDVRNTTRTDNRCTDVVRLYPKGTFLTPGSWVINGSTKIVPFRHLRTIGSVTPCPTFV